jgi:hypothetical protein
MSDTDSYDVVRQMGLTHEEFLRSLPAATRGMDCRAKGDCILISNPRQAIRIELGPVRLRSLGSLALPQTRVRVRFEGFSQKEREEFLRRFDLAFQRGGG